MTDNQYPKGTRQHVLQEVANYTFGRSDAHSLPGEFAREALRLVEADVIEDGKIPADAVIVVALENLAARVGTDETRMTDAYHALREI